MTALRIEFHPGAREDYLAALEWYLERSAHLAQRFHDELLESLERIVANPQLAAADADGVRWRRLTRFPQLVYFRLTENGTIQVLAVAHERQHPDYWKQRLP